MYQELIQRLRNPFNRLHGLYQAEQMNKAADAIETQAAEIAALRAQLAEKGKEIVHWKEEAEMWSILRKDADRIREGMMGKELRLISAQVKLEADLARVTAELDAAVADLVLVSSCRTCGNRTGWCDNPDACKGYEWRGLTELPGAKSDA